MSEKRILIVDDEASIILALKSFLMSKGYEVSTAENGQQGLEIAREFLPDLILLDVMMPFMDGFAFSKAIREDETLQDTKIIFITAKGEMKDKQQGYAKGGDDYLVKPFSTEKLLNSVEFLLEG